MFLASDASGMMTGTIVDMDHPQPALWTLGPIQSQRGRQKFPALSEQKTTMTMSGRHFGEDAHLFVNGRRVDGQIEIDKEVVKIELARIPPPGMHLLQVQNPDGLFSNDFIFHVKPAEKTTASTP